MNEELVAVQTFLSLANESLTRLTNTIKENPGSANEFIVQLMQLSDGTGGYVLAAPEGDDGKPVYALVLTVFPDQIEELRRFVSSAQERQSVDPAAPLETKVADAIWQQDPRAADFQLEDAKDPLTRAKDILAMVRREVEGEKAVDDE